MRLINILKKEDIVFTRDQRRVAISDATLPFWDQRRVAISDATLPFWRFSMNKPPVLLGEIKNCFSIS